MKPSYFMRKISSQVFRITDFAVTVGVINKAGNENSKAVYYTKEKFVHKNYDDVYLTSDIALLKLPTPVNISGDNNFVCILKAHKIK
jgi:Trypsin